MTSSISGLASGLDTASIIDQLMQLEAISQNRLKAQQSTQKSVMAALQSVNTDVSLLGSKAATLAKPETWQTLKGTSSNPNVAVTASSTATATNFSVTVNSVAVAHQVGFAFNAPTTGTVTTGPMRLDFPGSPSKTPITLTTDGTLQGLATAINDPAKNTGLTATVVRTGSDATGAATYGLVVTANQTGAASQFTLTYDDAGGSSAGSDLPRKTPTPRVGTDAQITLGAGLTLTSSTNTFDEVAPGVGLTLSPSAKAADTATITVAQDPSGVRSSVQALVTQVNDLLTKLDTQSANASGTGASATPAGILAGDATVRSLRSAIADTVFGSGNTSMASLGIQTDRYGKLVFDAAAFDKAYAADPAGTAAKFTTGATTTGATTPDDGFAARVAAVAKAASDSTNGTITSAITGRKSTIDRLGQDIEDWDTRLELRRTSLSRQYTALETALSSLQSQGNWLAGQIAHLPTSS